MKSRVVRFAQTGEPSVLRVDQVELGGPGPGQVRIKQTAVGLNYQDVLFRQGVYPQKMPGVLGTEAAGAIEAVGEGVTDFAPGDRVAYAGGPPGAYADYRNVGPAKLVKLPDDITDEQGAAFLMKGMVAEYLLNRVYLVRPGEWALFWAAAGGVGLIAGQWGKSLGARMIGVAGGGKRCQAALAHGYEVVIDRQTEDVAARVKEVAGEKGVPVVYDSAGKETFAQTVACLAPRGHFVSFGAHTGEPPDMPAATLRMNGSLYFTRPTLVTYTAGKEELIASAAAVFNRLSNGTINGNIGKRYDLEEAVQAHQDLESSKNIGPSVLLP